MDGPDGIGLMVIIGRRKSKSTFGANKYTDKHLSKALMIKS